MSRPGTPPDPVESATTLHAQAVAALLQTRDEVSSRSSVLRYHELRQQAQTGKQLDTSLSVPSCRRCGAFMIPGWTGSMQLVRQKPGRRKRKKMEMEEDAQSIALDKQQQWHCQCGWIQDVAKSDQNKRKTFKKRRIQDPLKQHSKPIPTLQMDLHPSRPPVRLEPQQNAKRTAKPIAVTAQQAMQPESAESMDAQESQSTHAPSSLPSHPAKKYGSAVSGSASHAKTTPKVNPAPSNPASKAIPTSSSSNTPSTPLDKAPSNKRKKSKKEGLQAMLQARKENEAKAQNKTATGGLGLSSFLQSL